MKIILLCIFILSSGIIYSQPGHNTKYQGALSDLYLNHQPSAKAEAMGRGLVANIDGDFGSYYNPALTSLSKGLNFNFSYSAPEESKSSYNYLSLSYTDSKLGSFGMSRYYWGKGKKDNYRDAQVKGSIYNALYTLNYSKEVIKDFYAGVNIGVYHIMHYPDIYTGIRVGSEYKFYVHDDGVTLDLGLLKKFNLNNTANEKLSKTIQLGAALYNLTGSKVHYVNYEPIEEPLPVIFRIGSSYEMKVKDNSIRQNFDIFKTLTHLEFQKILNSEYDAIFKIGQEMIIWEVAAIRVGYFYSKIYDGSQDLGLYYSDQGNATQSEFTFGLGLNLPLSDFLKLSNPLSLKIDFTSITPPDHNRYPLNLEKYYTVALNLNYIP